MKNFIVEDFCPFSLNGIIASRGADVYFGNDYRVSWYELPFSTTVNFLAYCDNDFIKLKTICHDLRDLSTDKPYIDMKSNIDILKFSNSNMMMDDYGRIGMYSEGYWREDNIYDHYEHTEE